jgi:hypothetical protein
MNRYFYLTHIFPEKVVIWPDKDLLFWGISDCASTIQGEKLACKLSKGYNKNRQKGEGLVECLHVRSKNIKEARKLIERANKI